MHDYELSFADSISEIGASAWNSLTATENPFMRYEFLHGLETTGCTTQATGWQPMHVWVKTKGKATNGEECTIAVVPLFLKTNSWGEYVFDWSWANAYKSYGFDYYPKFVTAAPFTPSVGQRIFIDCSADRKQVLAYIVEKVKEKAEVLGASSWHILFPLEQEHNEISTHGIQARIGTQFHWFNKEYESFDHFLEILNSRKRKAIRKERQHIQSQDISFRVTEGPDISEQQWSDFYLFYQSTYLMRGMQGYLEQDFFRVIAETMPEQIFLINATQDNQDIAAALFFKNSEKLFGRYWGCRRDHQFLHFETCYYQGQDYAIDHKLKSFDSGAQGEHKIQRGFEPIFTYSNHWIANQGFADAIESFLTEERAHIYRYRAEAESLLPFKKQQ
ncbi:MAG: GNAT family N-acetyltransferase [Pseudomonadales bacterium]|nr:GNAT family N-acetyltransferase [Pseudomonadales bacterium]